MGKTPTKVPPKKGAAPAKKTEAKNVPPKKVTAKAPAKVAAKVAAKASTQASKKAPAKSAKDPALLEAERIAKEAAVNADKMKKDAEAKAKQAKAKAHLEQTANEINVRFEKAEKLGSQADDHRLAAALKLAEAKKECRDNKLDFAKWCEENFKTQTYNTIRQLIPIGVAESEKKGAGVLMLADLRNKNAQRNKEHRERQKATKTSSEKSASAKTAPPAERALSALDAMKGEEKTNLLRSAAKNAGLEVMTKEEKSRLALGDVKGMPPKSARLRAEEAFNEMSAKARVGFAAWCAEQIGATFSMGGAPAEAGE